MRDDPLVTDLVTRAKIGDQRAWDALVERYAALVWGICRRHRLGHADAEDVNQNVWLRLVEHLDSLRDPAAVAGWLATTTQRECVRVLRTRNRPAATPAADAEDFPDNQAMMADDELLLAERHTAVREAFASLSPTCQRLLTMLIQDPPVPYVQISTALGIPIGSIGPTRGRCLDKLRRHPAITALINLPVPDPPDTASRHAPASRRHAIQHLCGGRFAAVEEPRLAHRGCSKRSSEPSRSG